MDINIKCKSLQITAWNTNAVDLEISHADGDEILDYFTESEIVHHFDHNKLLDEIGEQECIDHFGLIQDNI